MKFLVSGAAGLEVPFRVLLYSVLIFVLVPLLLGTLSRILLMRRKGMAGLERVVRRFAPVTIVALCRMCLSTRQWFEKGTAS